MSQRSDTPTPDPRDPTETVWDGPPEAYMLASFTRVNEWGGTAVVIYDPDRATEWVEGDVPYPTERSDLE